MVSFKNARLKRFWRPSNKIKPKVAEEKDVVVKEQPQEVVTIPVNPMIEFFNDMEIIRLQSRDPNLTNKPSYDVGGPVFQNYLIWLQLAELMKLNRKIDELLKKNA